MSTPAPSRVRGYRFGPFEADLPNAELKKEGLRIRIERKPWQVLIALLERPGETVSRAELEKRLWPDGVFVDFEHGVNVAVKKLRSALLDSATEPRYVVTIPGHGYRFIAAVEEIAAPQPVRMATIAIPHPDALQTSPEPLPVRAVTLPYGSTILLPDPRRQKIETLTVAALLVVLTFAAGVGLWWPKIKRLHAAPSAMVVTDLVPGGAGGEVIGTSISPDGKYVAYGVDKNGKRTIWLRQLATGSAIRLAEVPRGGRGAATFSHDGSLLYFHNRRDVMVVPTLGGAARKVVSNAIGSTCISRDGKRIAFTRVLDRYRTMLMIADADGTNERTLAERTRPFEWFLFDCAWSPDNQRIAIGAGVSDGAHAYNALMTYDVDSGRPATLSNEELYFVGRVNWLADNSAILFDGARFGEAAQLFELSVSDGALRRLSGDMKLQYMRGSFAVADDGETAVGVRQSASANLWRIRLNGSEPELVDAPTGSDGYGGSFSIAPMSVAPDGRMFFASRATGSQAIWALNPDSGNPPVQITRDGLTADEPNVTPDGRYLVFTATIGKRSVICRTALDGSELRMISSGENAWRLALSPDSRYVFYSKADREGWGLWKAHIVSGEETRVVGKEIFPLAVSADGKSLLAFYIAGADAEAQMVFLSTESGEIQKVLPFSFDTAYSDNDQPRLTPDGHAYSYVTFNGGIENLWLQPLDGGAPRQITNFDGDKQIFAYGWVRDGSLLVVRGTRTSDAVLIRNLR